MREKSYDILMMTVVNVYVIKQCIVLVRLLQIIRHIENNYHREWPHLCSYTDPEVHIPWGRDM